MSQAVDYSNSSADVAAGGLGPDALELARILAVEAEEDRLLAVEFDGTVADGLD